MIILYIFRLVDLVRHIDSKSRGPMMPPLEAAVLAVQMFVLIPTVLCVSCLFFYQMQLVAENMTSMESFDREFEERKARKKGKSYRFRYDRGCYRNMKDVLGNNVLLWVLPSIPPGDGLNYKQYNKTAEV